MLFNQTENEIKPLQFCHVLHFDTTSPKCSYLGAEFSPFHPQETFDDDGSPLRVNARTPVSQFFLESLY